MATQCDIGATVHVVFPPSGGVQMLVIEDGFATLMLSNSTLSGLLTEVKRRKDDLVVAVGIVTYRAAFRRLVGLQ